MSHFRYGDLSTEEKIYIVRVETELTLKDYAFNAQLCRYEEDKLYEISKAIEAEAAKAETKPKSSFSIGDPVFAYEEQYVRAEILEVNETDCLLDLVDYGEIKKVPKNKIFELSKALCDKWERIAIHGVLKHDMQITTGAVSVLQDIETFSIGNVKYFHGNLSAPSEQTADSTLMYLKKYIHKSSTTENIQNGVLSKGVNFRHPDLSAIEEVFVSVYNEESKIYGVQPQRFDVLALERKLDTYYGDPKNQRKLSCVEVNQSVIAPYGSQFCRAVILKIADEHAAIMYVDYGQENTIEVCKLIEPTLGETNVEPCFAMRCKSDVPLTLEEICNLKIESQSLDEFGLPVYTVSKTAEEAHDDSIKNDKSNLATSKEKLKPVFPALEFDDKQQEVYFVECDNEYLAVQLGQFTVEELLDLNLQITESIKNSNSTPTIFEPGDIVAVEIEGSCYRGLVSRVTGEDISVYQPDFGIVSKVSRDKIFALPDEFFKHAPIGCRCFVKNHKIKATDGALMLKNLRKKTCEDFVDIYEFDPEIEQKPNEVEALTTQSSTDAQSRNKIEGNEYQAQLAGNVKQNMEGEIQKSSISEAPNAETLPCVSKAGEKEIYGRDFDTQVVRAESMSQVPIRREVPIGTQEVPIEKRQVPIRSQETLTDNRGDLLRTQETQIESQEILTEAEESFIEAQELPIGTSVNDEAHEGEKKEIVIGEIQESTISISESFDETSNLLLEGEHKRNQEDIVRHSCESQQNLKVLGVESSNFSEYLEKPRRESLQAISEDFKSSGSIRSPSISLKSDAGDVDLTEGRDPEDPFLDMSFVVNVTAIHRATKVCVVKRRLLPVAKSIGESLLKKVDCLEPILSENIKIGSSVVAKLDTDPPRYRRATVAHYSRRTSLFKLFLVDSGLIVKLPLQNLFVLPSEFSLRKTPGYATILKLRADDVAYDRSVVADTFSGTLRCSLSYSNPDEIIPGEACYFATLKNDFGDVVEQLGSKGVVGPWTEKFPKNPISLPSISDESFVDAVVVSAEKVEESTYRVILSLVEIRERVDRVIVDKNHLKNLYTTKPGTPALAFVDNYSNPWKRARVVGRPQPGKYRLFLVDMGIEIDQAFQKTFKCPPNMFHVPEAAVEVTIKAPQSPIDLQNKLVVVKTSWNLNHTTQSPVVELYSHEGSLILG